MRILTMTSFAALMMLAAPAAYAQTGAAQGSQGAGNSSDASSTEPPSKVWVYGQNGWMQRDVGEPMKAQMRGQRVARPMIYWQQGGSWYAMPDAAGADGRMMSDQLSGPPGTTR